MPPAVVSEWSKVPGLIHGFDRRPIGPETRDETRERVASSLRPRRLQLLKQVHGIALVVAPCDGVPTADASATDEPGVILGIETADCLPALFFDPRARRAAAAHAGWRGTAAGIARDVVGWLRARGSATADIHVALGPSIGVCCYEVGEELRPQFAAEDRAFFQEGPRGRPHLDVRGINERQLLAAGIPLANIAHVRECTHCLKEQYCSYRRDGAGAGRMISYIGWS
jgi:polyphenol oxidase